MIGIVTAPDPAADVLPPLPPFPGARRGHHGGGWLKDWQPGQSGNPSGHNAVIEVMQLCRELTPDAIAVLKKNLKHKNGQVQVAAATKILEFAWGKPTAMDGDGSAWLDLIREQLVTEVRMVIVEPDGTEREMPPRGAASTARGNGADPHLTGTSDPYDAPGGSGGHPGA